MTEVRGLIAGDPFFDGRGQSGARPMNSYRERMREERIARQAPEVQCAIKDLRETIKSIETYVAWALDPTEKDGGAYYTQNLLEHAHQLVDQAHAFRAALAAHPSPKDEDEEQESA
jgi:hypothetical protein